MKKHSLRCLIGWREKPLGTGEATVIVVPLDCEPDEIYGGTLSKLCKIFKVTTFSEETIDFSVQELD